MSWKYILMISRVKSGQKFMWEPLMRKPIISVLQYISNIDILCTDIIIIDVAVIDLCCVFVCVTTTI